MRATSLQDMVCDVKLLESYVKKREVDVESSFILDLGINYGYKAS